MHLHTLIKLFCIYGIVKINVVQTNEMKLFNCVFNFKPKVRALGYVIALVAFNGAKHGRIRKRIRAICCLAAR